MPGSRPAAARPSRSRPIPTRRSRNTTAVYLECDDLDARVDRLARLGDPVRAWPAQPAVDVARGAASRSRRQYDLPLPGRRSAPLPAVADGRRMKRPCFKLEAARFRHPLAGVDEAGCGPLAGPVVAAAVVLDRDRFPRGIDNSKKLALERARGDLRTTAEGRRDRRRHRRGRGNRRAQHLLGEDAGDDARGRGAGRAAGCEPAWVLVDGNATPRWRAAVEGDRRRRRAVPVDRRRLDRRQGHRDRIMADHARTHPGLWLGHATRAMPTPEHIARAATHSGRRRSIAAASRRSRRSPSA